MNILLKQICLFLVIAMVFSQANDTTGFLTSVKTNATAVDVNKTRLLANETVVGDVNKTRLLANETVVGDVNKTRLLANETMVSDVNKTRLLQDAVNATAVVNATADKATEVKAAVVNATADKATEVKAMAVNATNKTGDVLDSIVAKGKEVIKTVLSNVTVSNATLDDQDNALQVNLTINGPLRSRNNASISYQLVVQLDDGNASASGNASGMVGDGNHNTTDLQARGSVARKNLVGRFVVTLGRRHIRDLLSNALNVTWTKANVLQILHMNGTFLEDTQGNISGSIRMYGSYLLKNAVNVTKFDTTVTVDDNNLKQRVLVLLVDLIDDDSAAFLESQMTGESQVGQTGQTGMAGQAGQKIGQAMQAGQAGQKVCLSGPTPKSCKSCQTNRDCLTGSLAAVMSSNATVSCVQKTVSGCA